MKEIVCSRCRCVRTVSDTWKFRQCVKCYVRDLKRYMKNFYVAKETFTLEDVRKYVTWVHLREDMTETEIDNLLTEIAEFFS